MKTFLSDEGQVGAQLSFDNGYTISIVRNCGKISLCNTSVASWPTKKEGDKGSHGSELSDEEVGEAISAMMRLPKWRPMPKDNQK